MKCRQCGQELPPVLELVKQREQEYVQWIADRINNPNLKPLSWMGKKVTTYGDLVKPPSAEELQRRIDVVNEARLG